MAGKKGNEGPFSADADDAEAEDADTDDVDGA